MKTQGISFYFVLYIVAVISVFIITMERDQLLQERDEDIAQLIELYVRPLELTPYLDTATFFIDPGQSLTNEPIVVRTRVEGPIDREKVEFSLVRVWEEKNGRIPDNPFQVTNSSGDGVLSAGRLGEGIYHFQLAGNSRRIITNGGDIHLNIKDTTYTIPYSLQLENMDRDTVILIARVEKSGTDPLQFRLTIQDQLESWILGPPYQKKIFLNGIEESDHVTFLSPPDVQIERPTNKADYVTMMWERPLPGKRTFEIAANANRGFGGKDRSSISFTVEILPPTFITESSDNGFWGVPYTFDGRIQGLNPVDLSITLVHNDETVATGPGTKQQVFVPQPEWHSMEYRISYRGHIIKKHEVSLSAPPPPQIRWVGQDLDRSQNIFRISVLASDAAAGAVRVSIESQPSGIARLDKISGKDFAIAVSLDGQPSAVFLKLTASDKYGGRSVSTKQFNIPK